MKKLAFVLLLVLITAVPVMAQSMELLPLDSLTGTEPLSIGWADVEDAVEESGVSGTLYTVENDVFGFEIWIPDGLEPSSYENMYEEDDICALFADAEAKQRVVVTYRDLQCDSLEGVVELLKSNEDAANIRANYTLVNGLESLLFYFPAQDSVNLAIPVTDTWFVQVTVEPVSDKALNAVSGFILASVAPIHEAESDQQALEDAD